MERELARELVDSSILLSAEEKKAAYLVLTSLEGLTTRDAADVLKVCNSVLCRLIDKMIF